MIMANEEHLKILKQGKEIWNRWREEHPDAQPDLSRANLNMLDLGGTILIGNVFRRAMLIKGFFDQMDLSEAPSRLPDLIGANLSGANFSGAQLSVADLSVADLSTANLTNADLSGTDLHAADLSRADLSQANLRGTNLSGANLYGANFSRAEVGGTVFTNLDLSVAKGLDTAVHHYRSEISISTLINSHGQIPESFLRGCGVPDTFITYMASLTGKAFEYYSCFISYSAKDQAFAERLYNDLQGKGVRCWFAPEDMEGGKKVYDQIDQAIRVHDKLLLVLSEHSIGSQWVMTEIRRTRKAELRDKRQKLFPIRLVGMDTLKEWECFDADTGKDLAVEVREYHIPDFSNWENHAAYQPAFDRLLRDLKAEEG